MPRFATAIATMAVAGAVLAATLTGCTAGPSSRPAIVGAGGAAAAPTMAPPPQNPNALPPLESSRSGLLSWGNCDIASVTEASPKLPSGPRPQCATMPVRLGANTLPTGAAVRVNLLKVGTGKVPLVVLDDVDSEPGTTFAARLAARLPPALLSQFSVIGMDRRGTASSNGVSCVPQSDRTKILGFDPASDDLDSLLGAERDGAQECLSSLEDQLQSLDTLHTVGDLDQLREDLGVDHLNAIGRGEGSRVFGAYAKTYPSHVGRMIFDGFPDPNAEAQDRMETRATAAEDTFNAFAAYCTANGCPLGGDPRKAVTGLLSTLRGRPAATSDGVRMNPGLATEALVEGLADPDRWGELASALAAAAAGNGQALSIFVRPLLAGDDELGSRFDARMVSGCNDETARVPPQQVATLVKESRSKHPLFGAAMAQELLLCSPWPVSQSPVGKPGGVKLPPILMVATAHDPITPQDGTLHAEQQLDSAKLVSWEGAGHGALGQSACATEAATKFLAQATVPRSDIVCPA